MRTKAADTGGSETELALPPVGEAQTTAPMTRGSATARASARTDDNKDSV
jgi:hypothetical protein